MDITQLLAFSVKNKASDLHLSAGNDRLQKRNGSWSYFNYRRPY